MNLNNEDEKKDGLLPIISSSFKKTASFGKAHVFSKSTGGIMERLKNLSRKDMAFVGIGLSILIIAPVAEYLMSRPSADNLLTPGFGGREQGTASGLYEPGINGLSQGSPDGSGEVITPLSVRDPMSLILGSQLSMPPPSVAPSVNLRDAMKDAGRSAFSQAAKSAGAPTPIPRMQSALRSFGSFFSGGESSRTAGMLSGGKIIQDARSASGKSKARSMVGPVASAGYKGVAYTPNSGNRSALDKLRAQADKSAGNFSGGSAISSLDKAAADALEIGKGAGGLGAGGDSEKTRATTNSTNKNEHSNSGETLAQMMAKKRAEAAFEDWKDRTYGIPKKIRDMILTNIVENGLFKPMGDMVGSTMNSMLGNYPPTQYCWQPMPCIMGDSVNCTPEIISQWPPAKTATHLCFNPGSRGFKMQAPGKESVAAGMVKYCICGEGNKPTIGKIFDETPPPPGGDTNPGTNPGTTPGGAASDAANKWFADYDNVLQSMVVLTAEAEANASDPAKVETNVRSVKGGFQNLSRTAGGVVNILGNARNSAQEEKTKYSTEVDKTQAMFTTMRGNYGKFNTQLAKLEEDLNKDPSGKDVRFAKAVIAGQGVEKVISPEEMEAIKKAVADWRKQGPVGFNTAAGLLASHREWLNVYTEQLSVVGDAIKTISDNHAALDRAAANINIEAADITWLAKLKQMTGRPPEDTPAAPRDIADTDDYSDFRDAAMDESFPLKQAAEGLRALNWDTLWQKGNKFDSSKAANEETKAWNTWRTGGGQGQITVQPDNFVSNYMRSDEIKSDITGKFPDISKNIPRSIKDTESLMSIKKNEILAAGVNSCYFADGGCSGVAPPVVPPSGDFAAARDNAVRNAYVDLETAEQSKKFAQNQNAVLQAFEPKTPGDTAAMGRYKASGNAALTNIRNGESSIRGLITSMKACRDQACIDAKEELIARQSGVIKTNRGELDKAFSAAEKIKKPGQPAVVPPVHPSTGAVGPNPPVIPKPPKVLSENLVLFNGPQRVEAYDEKGRAILYWACDNKGRITRKPWYAIAARGISPLSAGYTAYTVYGGDPRGIANCSTQWVQKHATVNVQTFGLASPGMVPKYASASLPNVPPYKEAIVIPNPVKVGDPVEALRFARGGFGYPNTFVERGSFRMEIIATCKYSPSVKKWVFTSALLRKGKGDTTDEAGVEGGATVGIKIVELSGKASYNHTWAHYNFGVMEEYIKYFPNVECK